MRRLAPLLLAVLAACMPSSGAEVSMSRVRVDVPATADLPPAMASFGLRPAPLPARSNAEIAQDFLELSFRMESGRRLSSFSRFEGPVTVRLTGDVPASAATDFSRLLGRLRREAGIDIRAAEGPGAAITVQFLPRARIQATYANVACFVIPGVSGWDEFRARRGSAATDWTALTRRERVAIFIPSDGPAQEARDCLHEEMAQALGPINDLFRLSDSVFNDDNFQNKLTGFDMLILRATYAPELRAGMSEDEVAARLPGILARLHPGGASFGGAEASPTPRQWTNAVETALGSRGGVAERTLAARQAIGIARAEGWTDARLALGYFALGRLTLTRDPDTALSAFAEAGHIYRALPDGAVHLAHVEMQLAAHDLTVGADTRALARVDAALPVVEAAENAALTATLMMIRAEALEALGRGAEAQAVRLDSETWARYGFGSDAQVRARMTEIAVLARRG